MKLHRDLGISQKSAWHLLHRIREAWNSESNLFDGEVEADETFVGRKETNKHSKKKLKAGRGTVEKLLLQELKVGKQMRFKQNLLRLLNRKRKKYTILFAKIQRRLLQFIPMGQVCMKD